MQKKQFNTFNRTPLWACNASHVLGAGGSGAVYTMSANTMQKGSFFVGVNVERVANKTLSDKAIIDAMKSGTIHIHSIDAINSYSLSASYGITDTLTLNMQLPFISRINIRAGEEEGGVYEVHPHGDSKGLGDISAILQYKIYDEEGIKIAVLAGLKAPTGKTDVSDGHEVLEADLQPGSGSLDFFAGAALTKDFENFSIHSSVLYKYNTLGVNGSLLGDVFTYNGALSYKLIKDTHTHELRALDAGEEFSYSVDVFVELNGEKADKDYFSGVVANNTGHNVIFATTGVQVASESGYSFFFTVSKPIYQNFNGVQNDINYKSSFGVGKSF
ncbi:hypothetical protein MNB_SM-4-1185 [hydrothermal vent metagenome]|uniref:DUF3308 domain-containing protein n=1 Tax=hydrothermal vent metagenome TaxID=652676 RepID=A0A1W1CPT2_9ZZZZ